MEHTESEIYDIANKLVLRVLEMKPGDRTTVARLVKEIEPSLLDEDEDAMFGGVMFDVFEAFLDLARDEGDLLIDMSEHDGKVEGLPFNLDFIVTRRICANGLNVDDRLSKMKWFSFNIGGFPGGYSDILFRLDDNCVWSCTTSTTKMRKVDEEEKTTAEDVETLKNLIKDAGVLTWENEYYEPVLDGTQWKLEMRFDDGYYFACNGSNGYPNGFNELVEGLYELGLDVD